MYDKQTVYRYDFDPETGLINLLIAVDCRLHKFGDGQCLVYKDVVRKYVYERDLNTCKNWRVYLEEKDDKKAFDLIEAKIVEEQIKAQKALDKYTQFHENLRRNSSNVYAKEK